MSKFAATSAAPLTYTSTKVAITLHGREYFVTCGIGEESRLQEMVRLVDATLDETAARAANITETRLFMLTCLVLADKLIETRQKAARSTNGDEDIMVVAVDHLRQRIAALSQQIGTA